MSKLLITISDVKKIIFLIHKKTALKLQIKALDPFKDHGKLIGLYLFLNWTDSELKKHNTDDIENIEQILMEGYTENEITSMYKYHFKKAKRKFLTRYK